MSKKLKNKYDDDELPITFEEIMEILEEELYNMQQCDEYSYKPLDFHDESESQ